MSAGAKVRAAQGKGSRRWNVEIGTDVTGDSPQRRPAQERPCVS